MTGRYILDERGEPEPCEDLMRWARWFEEGERRIVKQTKLPDGQFVSTVFLGLDHSFGYGGPPLLWETMVFDSTDADDHQERYATRDEAVAGHDALVAQLTATAPAIP